MPTATLDSTCYCFCTFFDLHNCSDVLPLHSFETAAWNQAATKAQIERNENGKGIKIKSVKGRQFVAINAHVNLNDMSDCCHFSVVINFSTQRLSQVLVHLASIFFGMYGV